MGSVKTLCCTGTDHQEEFGNEVFCSDNGCGINRSLIGRFSGRAVVSPEVKAAAEAFMADPRVDAMYKEMASEAGQKERFNTLMELVRIASPSRFEMRRQAEITKRLVNDWGFAQTDIMTTPSGYLKGAGVQTVDGKPVYQRVRAHSRQLRNASGRQKLQGPVPQGPF